MLYFSGAILLSHLCYCVSRSFIMLYHHVSGLLYVSMSVSCLGGTEVDSNLNGFQMHPWFDIIHPLFCFISEK